MAGFGLACDGLVSKSKSYGFGAGDFHQTFGIFTAINTNLAATGASRRTLTAIMKQNLFLLIFTLFGLLSVAQSCPIQLSLRGKIINKVDLGKECGFSKLASVLEFEIIEFSDYSYKQKTIGLIIRCPDMFSEVDGKNYFEVNQVYDVMVEKEFKDSKSDFDYEVQNAEILKKYNLSSRYWVLPGNIIKMQ